MGINDYEAGRSNPFGTTPLDRQFDLEYQWGQQDEKRRREEMWRAAAAPVEVPMSPASSAGGAAENAPIPAQALNVSSSERVTAAARRSRKSLIIAIAMTAFFGPFGALYASKRVGLLLIVPFVAAGLYFAWRDDFAAYQTLWSIAVPVSVICAAVAVLITNSRPA